jgi:hypothetical protein
MKKITALIFALVLIAVSVVPASAGRMGPTGKTPANGTTLAGYKTIDICSVDDSIWRYSGAISVWNSGAVDTIGLNITDFIQYKVGPTWTFGFNVPITLLPNVIPAGTTQETAVVYLYSVDAAPLPGDIRNNASITILNHSGHLGVPWGPNPKVTWDGVIEPCPVDLGCTYTQGYWKTHPESWPVGFDPNATFYLSGKTWLEVLLTPVNESRGYYQLAHQYIAAVLNQANGAFIPQGIQDTLNLALPWLEVNPPGVCVPNGTCGVQKDWAATLDLFNNGLYPGGPGHCGEEVVTQ